MKQCKKSEKLKELAIKQAMLSQKILENLYLKSGWKCELPGEDESTCISRTYSKKQEFLKNKKKGLNTFDFDSALQQDGCQSCISVRNFKNEHKKLKIALGQVHANITSIGKYLLRQSKSE